MNTMLEERFVDLLLLSNSIEVDVNLECSDSFDMSGVIKAIEKSLSLKSSGM